MVNNISKYEESAILRNSVKNPSPNMAMVSIETVHAANLLIESLKAEAKYTLFEELEFMPEGVESSLLLFRKAREYSLLWEKERKGETGILFIKDTGGSASLEAEIDFWETMNAQRELWGSLQTYTIFILLPGQYEKMLRIAHHLTDWIPLKIDLIEPAGKKDISDRYTQENISDISGGITPKTARIELDNLWKEFQEAEKRGEKNLIRRFLLPGFRLALDRRDIKRAEKIREYIKEEDIQKSDLQNWRRLNILFYLYTYAFDNAEKYLSKLKESAEEAEDKRNTAFSYYYTGEISFRKSENKKALRAFQRALVIYEEIGDVLGRANCIQSIGGIHLRESRNKEAMGGFERALVLYEEIGSVLGKANCIKSIGDIHLIEFRNKEAMGGFERALVLYEEIGDVLGRANCIQSIGEIHLRESRNKEAMEGFERASVLYEEIGDVLGRANCIQLIGEIHLRESRTKEALRALERALELYEEIGDVLGRANCIQSIGDIHFRESRIKEALSAFEEALELYEEIGDVLGKANCIRSIGVLSFISKDYEKSEEYIDEALKLYKKINDLYSQANTYFGYGRIMKNNREYEKKGIEFIKKAADIFDAIDIPSMAEECRRGLS